VNRRPELRVLVETVEPGVLPPLAPPGAEEPESGLFDAVGSAYDALASRAEGMVVEHVCAEVEGGMKAHVAASAAGCVLPLYLANGRVLMWMVRRRSPLQDEFQLAPGLLGPVAALSAHLFFLHATLPPPTSLALYRLIAARLSAHILQRQILSRGRARVSPAEGKRLLSEVELWVHSAQEALRGVPRGRVEAPWRALLTAARVLGAGDEWVRIRAATFGAGSDEAWEGVMEECVGMCGMGREDVGRVCRLRTDWEG
jgi:hypothetical protein